VIVNIFDRFTKPKPPKGYAAVNVTFTAEEQEVIERALSRYASIANEEAPEGMVAIVPDKLRDGMIAQGLSEYVENLMILLDSEPAIAKRAELVDKGIRAMMKAYAVHNLPIYLFQTAGMFELLGDDANAKVLFGQFLKAENEFRPDELDRVFLNQMGFDFAKSVQLPERRLGRGRRADTPHEWEVDSSGTLTITGMAANAIRPVAFGVGGFTAISASNSGV
jgi:hypothetical protein